MQLYWIERAFQNVKEQLGIHQYQVRSWNAWYHHIALSLMTLHFLLQIQKEDKAEMPLLSVSDIKFIFAKKLLNNLNSDDGLVIAITTDTLVFCIDETIERRWGLKIKAR